MYSVHLLDKNLERLLQLYQTDMSLIEIAKELHVCRSTLQAKIRELGLKRKPRLRKKIDNKLFKQLAEMGLNNVQIAGKLGLHERTVSNYKRRLGLSCRDEEKIAIGKKAAACREYYKKTGMRPECPASKNVLEKYKETVIELLEQGASKTKIAKRYGVCLSTVYNFIHLYGLDVPQKKICDDKDKQIIDAFIQGKSLEDISGQLSCSSKTLQRKMKGMDLFRPRDIVIKKSILNNQRDLVEELYKQGLSGQEIADRLNVSRHNVYCCIRRFNFKRLQKHAGWSVFRGHDEELRHMRQSGWSLRKIGEYFGVNANTVLYRLKKLENIT